MGPWLGSLFAFHQDSIQLTQEQNRIYVQERLDNFRWASQLFATRSSYVLTSADLAPPAVANELSEIGQFVEVAHSPVPIDFLLAQRDTLLKQGFPLEGYTALKHVSPNVKTVRSTVADVPAYLFYRPEGKQLVVTFPGTTSARMALRDIQVVLQPHPSHKGWVHSGFWAMYQGMKTQLLSAIQAYLQEVNGDIEELVMAGHSMGAALASLLSLEILSSSQEDPLFEWIKGLRFKLAASGTPRIGNSDLANHYRAVVERFKVDHGHDSFIEYSIKIENDGVPALPPTYLGYRHFANRPLYFCKGMLFTTPESENEHALFSVSIEPPAPVLFPRGGHNYYHNRDHERQYRRLCWLIEADYRNSGWEDRYRGLAS